MRKTIIILILGAAISQIGGYTRAWAGQIYLCRSPLLAYDFYNSLIAIQKQGIVVTPTIATQLCNGMRAGRDPQCIVANDANFRPFATGWNGSLAMTNGSTKTWFHAPDGFGWIDSRYYIYLLNTHHL